MPDKIANTLKTWGLTPWQGLAGIAFVACWFTTLRPMPQAVAELNATVAELTTKVEVHAVLIQQMSSLTAEVNELRNHVAVMEGKLHAQK
jgi:hypothetical protein